jgi:voltage-dependent calcium channel L type alpha-1S
VEWVWFDRFILFTIILNSVFLAMYDYSFRVTGEKTVRNQLVDDSELSFLIIFTIEAILKILAYGFVLDRNTYIRDPWNILDFIVVFFGWLS